MTYIYPEMEGHAEGRAVSGDVKARFVPREDITTYELAVIVKKMRGPTEVVTFGRGQWEALEPEIKRHFEVVAP